ncbi:hydroxylacyl-CoA dehydrogenase [Tsukamurella pulmonis]|uniref:3-hydroxyacyl-CoA dehydrogenase NAD-binding domain-containing protein n=1 Tax=Tsukamurella pulmonis TaxID=47312 RepID=UPI000797085D|nr:hydroxylacyl-CoA dehydrogenase [Tsukamurella pulmonis]RDH09996.1 hydroxylacyl-CoA dehydrogenase [Tsukamurella pulmonis]
MAIIGAGVIGLSWAELAREHGWEVAFSDPRPDLAELVATQFPGDAAVEVAVDLAAAVAGADLVQENGPERLPVKRELFAQILAAAPGDAVLATSSSSIGATPIAAELDDPSRVIVGHPFNPPALMPLVEVVPGEHTSEATTQLAVTLYRELGRSPVVLRKEIPGFVANRLQLAVSREARYLVEQGVVSVADLDVALRNSLGLRWASTGLFEGNALGGGPEGAKHLFAGVGAQVGSIELGTPSSTPESTEALVAKIDAAYGVGQESYDRLLARRDRRTRAVLEALRAADEGEQRRAGGND